MLCCVFRVFTRAVYACVCVCVCMHVPCNACLQRNGMWRMMTPVDASRACHAAGHMQQL